MSTQLTGVGGGGNRLWVNGCTLHLHVTHHSTHFLSIPMCTVETKESQQGGGGGGKQKTEQANRCRCQSV